MNIVIDCYNLLINEPADSCGGRDLRGRSALYSITGHFFCSRVTASLHW